MSTSLEDPAVDSTDELTPAEPELQLEMTVEAPETCLREVIVTIPRSEIDRYLTKEYDGLVGDAQVPGFRAGRAPRKLVEKQFKDRVHDRVKGALLMDSLAKVTDSDKFSAIGEPDFDFESIDLPKKASSNISSKSKSAPSSTRLTLRVWSSRSPSKKSATTTLKKPTLGS